jgi:hypothetical protein
MGKHIMWVAGKSTKLFTIFKTEDMEAEVSM